MTQEPENFDNKPKGFRLDFKATGTITGRHVGTLLSAIGIAAGWLIHLLRH